MGTFGGRTVSLLTNMLVSAPGRTARHRLLGIPCHRSGERFLRGPIPWAWLTLAAAQPGKALAVAIVIWFWVGIKNTATVSINLSRMPVGRAAAGRGLLALERAGLVVAQRRKGSKSIVTILSTPTGTRSAGAR